MNKKKRYWHEEVGYNYRLTNLQAAIGCAQLEKIQCFIDKRQWIKDKYNERLAGLSCVLPEDKPPARSVNWLYTILLPDNVQEVERDQLIVFLSKNKIDSRPVFYPLHAMPPYRSFARPTPNAESLSRRGMTLPSYYALKENDIDRICGLIRQWLCK